MVSLADQGYLTSKTRSVNTSPRSIRPKSTTSRSCAFSMSSGLYSSQEYQVEPNLTLAQSTTGLRSMFTPGTQIAYDSKGMQAAGRAELATVRRRRSPTSRSSAPAPTNTHYDNFGTNPSVPGGITTTATDDTSECSRGGTNDVGDRVLTTRALGWMFINYTEGFPIYYSYNPYYQYGRTDRVRLRLLGTRANSGNRRSRGGRRTAPMARSRGSTSVATSTASSCRSTTTRRTTTSSSTHRSSSSRRYAMRSTRTTAM